MQAQRVLGPAAWSRSCGRALSRSVIGLPRPAGRAARPSSLHRSAAESTAVSGAAAAADAGGHPIKLTDQALRHLKKLRAEAGGAELLLRVGVKQGGCSGMSYCMDFESPANVKDDDFKMEFGAAGEFRMVCDPKSLLFLFGMTMDYSDALIGGGFNFSNPNAQDSCGCGKSFGV